MKITILLIIAYNLLCVTLLYLMNVMEQVWFHTFTFIFSLPLQLLTYLLMPFLNLFNLVKGEWIKVPTTLGFVVITIVMISIYLIGIWFKKNVMPS